VGSGGRLPRFRGDDSGASGGGLRLLGSLHLWGLHLEVRRLVTDAQLVRAGNDRGGRLGEPVEEALVVPTSVPGLGENRVDSIRGGFGAILPSFEHILGLDGANERLQGSDERVASGTRGGAKQEILCLLRAKEAGNHGILSSLRVLLLGSRRVQLLLNLWRRLRRLIPRMRSSFHVVVAQGLG